MPLRPSLREQFGNGLQACFSLSRRVALRRPNSANGAQLWRAKCESLMTMSVEAVVPKTKSRRMSLVDRTMQVPTRISFSSMARVKPANAVRDAIRGAANKYAVFRQNIVRNADRWTGY